MHVNSKNIRSLRGEKVIISGVGRSGTTFLVQLFSALNFDTGYALEEALSNVDDISYAGLEKPLVADDNVYLIKSPWFSTNLMQALDDKEITISHAIIPVRDLFEAAESRRRVARMAKKARRNTKDYPGALWLTDKSEEQEQALATAFYKIMNALIVHQIPISFLSFPRMIHDAAYCCAELANFLALHGVERDEFMSAHRHVARPDLIHDFCGSDRERDQTSVSPLGRILRSLRTFR